MKNEKEIDTRVDGQPESDGRPTAADNKPTPGPWSIKRAAVTVDGEYDYAIYSADKQVIAEAFGRTSVTNYPPAEANARLIAAAPELLDVAQALLACDDENDLGEFSNRVHFVMMQAHAAVAKAKAEGRA